MKQAIDYQIRPMNLKDVDGLLHVQIKAYPEFLHEDAEFFMNRMQLASQMCWVAEQHNHIVGYLVSYPWLIEAPPALNSIFDELPECADSWFIHDCAVVPEAQGKGIAKNILLQAQKIAVDSGFKNTSLVALASAVPYWLHYGYTMVEKNDDAFIRKMADYGEGSCFMMKEIEA